MKKILLILLILLIGLQVFATGQKPDRLVYKGDTILLLANPLQQLNDYDSLSLKLIGEQGRCFSTACWRGYIAEWEIIDNQLYLIGIISCCYYEDNIRFDLADLFGTKCVEGKVKADWVMGEVLAGQGKLLYYINDGYQYSFEREIAFDFVNGELKSMELYDNSKSKYSVYSQDKTKLLKDIYSNIKWDYLPKQDSVIRVYLRFSANEEGVIDDVEIIRGGNYEVYNQEAIRVIKSTSEWDVYIRKGKVVRQSYSFPIVFSEANRLRYK